VTNDDLLTNGEIRRVIARLEAEDRSLAIRLTNLAAEMVPVKLWDSEHRALIDKLAQHEKSADASRARLEKAIEEVERQLQRMREEQEKRSEVTWQKVTGLIVAMATIVGVLVALLGVSKGIH
jgi:predicted anti-sigma-YlaC factor YlaD